MRALYDTVLKKIKLFPKIKKIGNLDICLLIHKFKSDKAAVFLYSEYTRFYLFKIFRITVIVTCRIILLLQVGCRE